MRGYQKRIIHLKNPGSAIFEEAFFVLKDEGGSSADSDSVIREANRIIEENALTKDGRVNKKRGRKFLLLFLLSLITVCSIVLMVKAF